LIDTLIDTFIL